MVVEANVRFPEQISCDGQINFGGLGIGVPQERRESRKPTLDVHAVAIPPEQAVNCERMPEVVNTGQSLVRHPRNPQRAEDVPEYIEKRLGANGFPPLRHEKRIVVPHRLQERMPYLQVALQAAADLRPEGDVPALMELRLRDEQQLTVE